MKKRVGKTIGIIVSVILAVAIIAVGSLAILYRAEISSMSTVTKVSDAFYTMNCKHDYDLQALLDTGVSSDQELLDYIIDKITYGIVDLDINMEDYACTTFNAHQSNGDVIFGRNFDYMDAPCMLVWTDPDDGYASVSMINLEFCGYDLEYLPDSFINKFATLAAPYVPVDGLNEKGLSIGVLELENGPTSQDTEKGDLVTSVMIRLVLDKAATVDEAIQLFESYDMHDSAGCGYHYQITDSTGKSVVLEYVNGEISLIYPDDGKNYISAANYYLSANVDDPHGYGQNRTEVVYNGLDASDGIVSIEEAMDLLEGAKMVDESDPNGYICSTLWSAVYNNTKLNMTICPQMDFENSFTFGVFAPEE